VDEVRPVLLDLDVVDRTVVGKHPGVLEVALAEPPSAGGLEQDVLRGDRRSGYEEGRGRHSPRRAGGDQELVVGSGADLGPAYEVDRHQRPAVVMAEHALDRARAPAMGHDVDLGTEHDGVARRLEDRVAAVEQRVERPRPSRSDDLGPGHEAVPAVVVAAEHAEGKGRRSGQGVEEGLLLDGIDLERAHVPVRDLEGPRLVESDAADPVLARRNQAAMAAREAADTLLRQFLVQVPLARAAGEEIGQRRSPGRHKPLSNIRLTWVMAQANIKRRSWRSPPEFPPPTWPREWARKLSASVEGSSTASCAPGRS
jgi:hypothetical protein